MLLTRMLPPPPQPQPPPPVWRGVPHQPLEHSGLGGGSAALTPGRTLAIKHTTVWARVKIKEIVYRVDINTLHRDETATKLELNEIGRVRMRCTRPLFMDEYTDNRATGAVILVDEATNRTVGAGFLS